MYEVKPFNRTDVDMLIDLVSSQIECETNLPLYKVFEDDELCSQPHIQQYIQLINKISEYIQIED